jgi:primosomal protein N' (replication factor Y)
MRIARVEPMTSARALRGPFDYLLPEDFPQVQTGSRLSVPFARRRIEAVVVEVDDKSDLPIERLSSPYAVVEPAIPHDLLTLSKWLAPAYCSTLSRALALVSPPGGQKRTGPKVRLFAALTDTGRKALSDGSRLTEGQRGQLETLLEGPLAAAEIEGGHQSLRRLSSRGLVELVEQNVARRPAGSLLDPGRLRPPLNDEQKAALGALTDALGGVGFDRQFLLHGITGSGKTEVYIGAAEAALEQGKGVIVLVPEIALTPQALARFSARLGDTVAVIHSGLSAGERRDEWMRLSDGEAKVVVGPRSAVFAPVRDLGLVIVDEEHESSYRNDGDPGYDAREVAIKRAEISGAVLVAGSATPRPESAKRLKHLRLFKRADGAPLPPVELLDMRSATGPLHAESIEALGEVKREGGKAIVLLNRRGWSNFLTCRSCGRTWECPQCDVTLVLHRSDGVVSCHHCGHREPVPSECPDCGSASVARHGAGTERIEAELSRLFASEDFPVMRLDADTASRRGGAEQLLADFQRASSGILIGTQMVAKGHDFPDVTLGLVVDADATLRFPDFRSEERTFQLVAQLAGRAGRGPKGGKVLVQTLAPEAQSLQFAAAHDADAFLEAELERRSALGYPPAAAIVRIVCSAETDQQVDELADAIVANLAGGEHTILGPADLFRLRGRERRQIVVRSTDRAALVASVDTAVAEVSKTAVSRGATIGTEVDAG